MGRGLEKKIESLYVQAKNNGIRLTKGDIKTHILENRRTFHQNQKLEADKNIRRFIKYLYKKGYKLFILSGSGLSKEEIQQKLHLINMNKYFSNENILSCKTSNTDKDGLFELLHFDNSQIIYFNDYIDGFEMVNKLDGINFGVIDKSNPSQSLNAFINSNTHYVIKSWKSWRKIANIIENAI